VTAKGKEAKDSWNECGQVFFTGGCGYGLMPDLRSICLGKEEDITRFFDTGELNAGLSPLQRQLLGQIQEYRKGEGIGTGETDMERAGINGAARRNKKAARQSTPRKRLALRSHKSKGKNIFRR